MLACQEYYTDDEVDLFDERIWEDEEYDDIYSEMEWIYYQRPKFVNMLKFVFHNSNNNALSLLSNEFDTHLTFPFLIINNPQFLKPFSHKSMDKRVVFVERLCHCAIMACKTPGEYSSDFQLYVAFFAATGRPRAAVNLLHQLGKRMSKHRMIFIRPVSVGIHEIEILAIEEVLHSEFPFGHVISHEVGSHHVGSVVGSQIVGSGIVEAKTKGRRLGSSLIGTPSEGVHESTYHPSHLTHPTGPGMVVSADHHHVDYAGHNLENDPGMYHTYNVEGIIDPRSMMMDAAGHNKEVRPKRGKRRRKSENREIGFPAVAKTAYVTRRRNNTLSMDVDDARLPLQQQQHNSELTQYDGDAVPLYYASSSPPPLPSPNPVEDMDLPPDSELSPKTQEQLDEQKRLDRERRKMRKQQKREEKLKKRQEQGGRASHAGSQLSGSPKNSKKNNSNSEARMMDSEAESLISNVAGTTVTLDTRDIGSKQLQLQKKEESIEKFFEVQIRQPQSATNSLPPKAVKASATNRNSNNYNQNNHNNMLSISSTSEIYTQKKPPTVVMLCRDCASACSEMGDGFGMEHNALMEVSPTTTVTPNSSGCVKQRSSQ